jgi:hypothetical protein
LDDVADHPPQLRSDAATSEKRIAMPHLIARVEVKDAWLRTHLKHVEDRRPFSITHGPIYRDINDPNAVLVHTIVDDIGTCRWTTWRGG